MMRVLKIMMITFILGGLLAAPVLGCSSEPESAVLENQIVTVQRGDLTIDITAAGNLALSRTEDLAFEIAGTVEEVLVEEGDSVEEGQVLVRLDASGWEAGLTALEVALLQAQTNLQTAEDNVQNVEYALELAALNAKIALRTAYRNLHQAEEAEDWLNEDINELKVDKAKMEYDTAKQDLAEVEEEIARNELQVKLAELHLEDAQRELDEALNVGPEITTPFDGFITKVNVEGGDEVLKGTVAVTIADPNAFEADILVSEMDILQIKLGGEAWVQVDAMQGLSLPAEVTHISPTATIQSGVVNYEVTVEVASLEEMMQERQAARQEAKQKIAQGELPERLKQAIEEGQITQEEAEEMMKQMQQAQGGKQGQVPAVIPEDFQLREGLTVTVSIIVQEKNDVLLVPNGAITTQGKQTYVQLVLPDGTTEERAITTGISDWQYTEVTEGLSEGEQIIVPQGTATTTTTPQQQKPPGKFIPRMGK
jgi:HlyD family secretion protein